MALKKEIFHQEDLKVAKEALRVGVVRKADQEMAALKKGVIQKGVMIILKAVDKKIAKDLVKGAAKEALKKENHSVENHSKEGMVKTVAKDQALDQEDLRAVKGALKVEGVVKIGRQMAALRKGAIQKDVMIILKAEKEALKGKMVSLLKEEKIDLLVIKNHLVKNPAIDLLEAAVVDHLEINLMVENHLKDLLKEQVVKIQDRSDLKRAAKEGHKEISTKEIKKEDQEEILNKEVLKEIREEVQKEARKESLSVAVGALEANPAENHLENLLADLQEDLLVNHLEAVAKKTLTTKKTQTRSKLWL